LGDISRNNVQELLSGNALHCDLVFDVDGFVQVE